MDINRKYLAILAVLVAVNIVMAGLLYARLRERPVDPMAPVAGFTSSQINAPGLPADDPNHWETKPYSVSERPPSAGYSLQSRFSMGTSYAVWGGELRCWVQNTGQKDLFVYGFSIEGDWAAPVCATAGITVQSGAERYLGILHFPGPALPGNYHFTVKTAIMVPTFVGGLLQSWYDFGHVGNAVKNIQILPVGEKPHYSEIKNPRYYFDKTNRIMAKDGSAKTKAAEIVANYSGGYSIYQAAAAFDFVFGNVVYVNDPAGRDYWATPDETLQKMTGDCEDHALLLSALITALGGNARFHVEKDHAFLSVFAGNDISAAQLALERYYNTGLQAAYFQDRFGYWLAADSTASMYLGGLPLGGEPLASGWGLTNTTFHYIVDMMPG